jgi:large subunit ribosomal protein LP0
MPADRKDRKNELFNNVGTFVNQYKKIIFVRVDNVTSTQMQQIRKALRGKAIVMMGKNTMIRRSLRNMMAQRPDVERLLPLIKGNVGFIFTNENLSEIKTIITANRVAAPARVGAIAPVSVVVPAGPTGLEPTQTSFLQALDIPSKINKGQVEITKDVQILKPGDKVGNSEAQLLKKLNIMPFTYGLEPVNIYDDGSIYGPAVLDITEADIIARFQTGAAAVTAVAMGAHYPTSLTVKHLFLHGYRESVLAIALGSDYSFPLADSYKAAMESGAAAAAAAPAAAPAKEEKKAAKEEVKEEEEDADMGFGLFD